jgi:hypothetical protein
MWLPYIEFSKDGIWIGKKGNGWSRGTRIITWFWYKD